MIGPFVLGLAGPGGVGKSTIAAAIAAQGAVSVVHIGGPVKSMLAAYYRECRVPDQEIARRVDGDLKRVPDPHLGGRTPTEALQSLGTEWGRDGIDPAIWVRPWRARAGLALAAGLAVINDSVRFQNEVEAIHDMGGVVIRLEGRGDMVPALAAHSSERGVDADFVVKNTGSVDETAGAVLEILRGFILQTPRA